MAISAIKILQVANFISLLYCVGYNGIEVEWEVLCNDSVVRFPHFRSLPLCLASLADYPLTNVFALSFGGQG